MCGASPESVVGGGGHLLTSVFPVIDCSTSAPPQSLCILLHVWWSRLFVIIAPDDLDDAECMTVYVMPHSGLHIVG